MDAKLKELLAEAQARVDAMPPAEREEMYRQQRESYVRGEMGMGSDADEAEYRRRMTAGEPLYDTPSGAPPKP